VTKSNEYNICHKPYNNAGKFWSEPVVVQYYGTSFDARPPIFVYSFSLADL